MNSSRRKFLLESGLVGASGLMISRLPPVAKLVDLILRDTIRSANADIQYIKSKYIYIALSGAPPRWVFDQFLQTKASDSVNPSAMAPTTFVASGGTYQSSAYSTVNYKGVLVPPIWKTQVATPGGTRPLSDLLDNLILFRGYGTGIDGHPGNAARQTNPVGGVGSMGGVMADLSASLFKALQFPSLYSASGYYSTKGTGLTAINYAGNVNYAAQLMNSFGPRSETTNLTALRARYSDYIDNAQGILRAIASTDQKDFPAVGTDQQGALVKIKAGVAGLDQVWTGLYNKYLTICNQTFLDRTSPGFNDMPIVTPQDDGVSIESVWTLHAANRSFPAAGQDLRDWVTNIDLSQMASSFALAEYAVTNNLVTTYEMGITGPDGVTGTMVRDFSGPLAQPTITTTSLIFDQHFTGAMTGLYLNSCLYRTIGACILELITQLKAANMFANSAIHMAGEFGRLPHSSGGGADHGFDAMVASVYSGLQSGGPMVLGNILREGTNGSFDPSYGGTFGYKGLTNVAGQNVYLTPSHVTSTLTQLLGMPTNPWGNIAQPLVSVSSTGVTAQVTSDVVDG